MMSRHVSSPAPVPLVPSFIDYKANELFKTELPTLDAMQATPQSVSYTHLISITVVKVHLHKSFGKLMVVREPDV